MSWSISIIINEDSKEEAIKLLDFAVKNIKEDDTIYISYHEQADKNHSDSHLPRLAYDSYKGIGGENDKS